MYLEVRVWYVAKAGKRRSRRIIADVSLRTYRLIAAKLRYDINSAQLIT